MINLQGINTEYKLYNFHSHTPFCDGQAPMEEFVEEAILQGFTHYGFSPHSPIPFDSPCNILKENVPLYLDEFMRLKSKYSDKINLYASMEIDYINDQWGPSNSYFDTLPLDYRIGSVHFIPSGDGFVDIDGRYESFCKKMGIYFDNDIEYVVHSYYSQTLKMIEAGGFDIIGHFDKIGHNAGHFREGIESEPWYDALVKTTFEAIMDKNLIIEVNTKAWELHHRFFPNIKYFDMLNKCKRTILINSDAHYPTLINAGREDAEKLMNGALI